MKPTDAWLAGFAGFRRAAEQVSRVVAAVTPKLPSMPELPATTFRCARCGEKAGRYTPRQDGPNFRTDFTCPKQDGPLQDPDVDEWLAKWTRLGKPDHLTLRLPPV